MTRKSARALIIAFALLLPEVAQSRPITLTCNNSENLYGRPYKVLVDSRTLTLQVSRPGRPFGGSTSYAIQQIEPDSDGFSIRARGRALNSQIRVVITADSRWIEYTDAFTNRTFAMDYCQ
jgi:hypothetical protein